MGFYEMLKQIDKSKENIVLTIISGEYTGLKLILSDGEILYKNSNENSWDEIIVSTIFSLLLSICLSIS